VSAAPVTTPRLPGLDVLKGVAIVGVVAIHTPPSDAPEYRALVLQGVARLAVPLFLVISGYLVGSRPPSRERASAYFWKFVRLHLLYGAFYWLFDPLRGVPWAPITPKVALMHFAAFSFPGQFYLFALLQIYFVLAFVVPERAWGRAPLLLASAALAVATIAWLTRVPGVAGAPTFAGVLASQAEGTAFLWLFPFCLGMAVGRRVSAGDPAPGAALAIALAGLAACVAALDLPRTGGAGYSDRFAYARWSVGIGTVLLALALPAGARRLRLAPLEALGRESFGIFVLNPLITGALKLRWLHAVDVWDSLFFLVLTLAIAYPLSRGLRRVAPFAFP
jgi:surface polysaccharide O-acyltransferase-like enzyme